MQKHAAFISRYDRRGVAILTAVGVIYFAAAKLGLSLAFTTQQVTAFWPPAGIAIAALLLCGFRVWPAILVSAFAVNALSHEPLLTAFGISVGNVAGPVAGVYGLRRWVKFDVSLSHIRDAIGLVFVGAMLAMTVTATNGVAELALAGIVPWPAYFSVWWVWWLGDTMGVLLLAPLVLAWATGPALRLDVWRFAELTLLAVGVIAFSLLSLTGSFGYPGVQIQMRYAIFPFIFWASLRFGHRESASIVAVVAAMAVWGAVHGAGSFREGTQDARLISLGLFMAATALTALAFGVLLTERAQALQSLGQAHAELENRVRKRTADLMESQFRFRAIVANVPGIVFQMRRTQEGTLRYTFLSDGIEKILGWTARQALADPALIFGNYLPEEEPERLKVFLDPDPLTASTGSREFRMRRADGAIRWLQSRWVLRQSSQGEVTWDGVSIDITEQKAREEELRTAKELVTLITENMPGLVFRREMTADGSPNYSYIAGRLLREFDLTAEDVQRNPRLLLQLVHPEDQPGQLRSLDPALEDLQPRRYSLRAITPGGETRWIEVQTQAFRRPDQAVYRDGLMTDVTPLKLAEAALAASEARYRTLLNNVPGVVFQQRLGKDGVPVFTYFSERLQLQLKLSPSDALAAQSQLYSLFLPEDDELRLTSLRESAEKLTLRDLEFRYKHPDGTMHWLHMRAEPHREPNGDIVWDGIVDDVTDRRRLEESLRQSERLEAMAQLTDGVAHNFNNLLSIISGYAENIGMDSAPESPAGEAVAHIGKAVERGAQLVKDLREFTRKIPAPSEGLPIGDMLRLVESLARSTLSGNIALTIHSSSGQAKAAVDGSRLQTALLHLILNARDALADGGTIDVAAHTLVVSERDAETNGLKAGRYVKISVKDNGGGMTKDVLERATNPFFTTKAPGLGTGLGLSMVYGFAKQSGGAFHIESAPNAGTEVTITLPAQFAT